MQAIQAERKAQRRQATRDLGIPPNQERTWSGQVRALGIEGDLLMLPVNLTAQQDLQDEDGNPLFMWGLSAFGGADPF